LVVTKGGGSSLLGLVDAVGAGEGGSSGEIG
jgi:hypothetical protein